MPVYYKLGYNNLSKIDKRLYLFRCKSYDEMKSIVDNEEDLKIIRRLEMLGMNRKFVSEYDREKVNKKLMNSLRNEGLKEGEKRGIIETAKNMLKDKLSIETISKYTGLSTKEIKSICL